MQGTTIRRPTRRPMLVPPPAPRWGVVATLALFGGLMSAQARARTQYRVAFVSWFLIQCSAYAAEYAVIYLMVRRFGQLRGWLPEEVIVLYALTLLSYGISGLFFMGTMGQLEQLVLRGELDQYLTKPLNPLLHMTARTFNLGYANHVVLSIGVLVVTLRAMDLSWSVGKAAYLLLAVAGAALI